MSSESFAIYVNMLLAFASWTYLSFFFLRTFLRLKQMAAFFISFGMTGWPMGVAREMGWLPFKFAIWIWALVSVVGFIGAWIAFWQHAQEQG